MIAIKDKVPVPYLVKPVQDKHFAVFKESCKTDKDCGKGDQYCTKFLWEATEDGTSYGYGSACYTWDDQVCP